MRAICHILRSIGYLTLLPYLASATSASFATCMPNPGAQFMAILLSAITMLFIVGYGDVLTMTLQGSAVRFWIASTTFYAAVAGLAIDRSQGDFFSNISKSFFCFRDALIPTYRPDSALDAVGGLTDVVLTVWMPLACVLSMVALVLTLRNSRNARARHGEMQRASQSEVSDPCKLSSVDDRG